MSICSERSFKLGKLCLSNDDYYIIILLLSYYFTTTLLYYYYYIIILLLLHYSGSLTAGMSEADAGSTTVRTSKGTANVKSRNKYSKNSSSWPSSSRNVGMFKLCYLILCVHNLCNILLQT